MRFILGVVVGVGLTIAAAYIHDRAVLESPANASVAKPFVNWDQVLAALGR
jgi:hypothetical protein